MTARSYVLIVEDDENWVRRCSALLNNAGYDTDVAASLDEMKERLRKRRYEYIVVPSLLRGYDYFAPVRTASDVCKSGCRLFVTTNLRSEEDMLEAYRLGAADYMSKRNAPSRLVRRMRGLSHITNRVL